MTAKPLVDAEARRRALTELDATFLVEAAAGTGKTALMAGRVAMLLADGRPPQSIAAITFTELAAGELALRIRQMVQALVRGEVPAVLQSALAQGLSPSQRTHLEASAARLDELTATTIHGFCQGIIRAYAVEADIDPGAAVMDAGQENALFERVFTRWLTSRLSTADTDADPVVVLAKDDPLKVVTTLRALANLRRDHRTARPPTLDETLRPDIDFVEAARDFARWTAAAPPERGTADLVEQIESLAGFFDGCLAAEPTYGELLRLTRPPRQAFMLRNALAWSGYARLTGWRRVAPDRGAQLNDEAAGHYTRCRVAFQSLIGHLGDRLVSGLSTALDDVMADYGAAKRAAAVLDFDDLLHRAAQLLRGFEPVRAALHDRYRHLLVDEFQDTDPLQSEIIFSLAAEHRPDDWRAAAIGPGALFLVGDPKQAIYRFRGAHVAAYSAVRDAFRARDPDSVLQLRANFRSRPGILEHVNGCFAPVLEQPGQPGYVPLAATLDAFGDAPCVVRLSIERGSGPDSQRDEEAATVAAACRRLIGALQVRRDNGTLTALKPGDIALLAPTKRDLWRYERALEAEGLSVASQAGEALMRRQESQDVLALLRTLADPLDTLAFGALMRGPLVGLTEAQLLDISAGLPNDSEGRPSTFRVTTPAEQVGDPIARQVVEVLQDLRRHAERVTPMALLAEAVERLHVRVALALRMRDRRARALANLDALIEAARPYAVKGLAALVADLQAAWEAKAPRREGRSDESDDAVSIVTMHTAKGLEWPVVFPINTSTELYRPDRFVHRQSDDTLHWVVDGVLPPELEAAQAEEARSASLERERLWYVACTRARDLLILPHMPHLEGATWAGIIDAGQSRLPDLDLNSLHAPSGVAPAADDNAQSREVFAAEAERVAAAAPPLLWRRPSDHDLDRTTPVETADPDAEAPEVECPVGAGRIRGILLHKLIEEILTGELREDITAAAERAAELLDQLTSQEAISRDGGPDPNECAATALSTLELAEVAALRPHLVPEFPVYGQGPDGVSIAGRMDAAAVAEGRITVVVDWKSDISPGPVERKDHAGQLAEYLALTDAEDGLVVYMSRKEVVRVKRSAA